MALLSVLAALSVAAPPSPPSPIEVQRSLRAGDVVTLARARADLAEAGVRVDIGPWALLDDLSRLMRCLPLGPVPEHEAPPLRAGRLALRLERIRLQRRLRDGVPAGTRLDDLLGAPWVRAEAPAQAELVRWPREAERWPDEREDPRPEASRCPGRLDGAKDTGEGRARRASARAAAERRAKAQLVAHLAALPALTATTIAAAYLEDAAAAGPAFLPGADSLRALEAALDRTPGPHRVAGLLALAKVWARSDAEAAQRVLRAILDDPARSPAEDSRARVQLAFMLEPDWARVLEVVDAARAPRRVDRPALDNVKARALYALGDRPALMRHGRRVVQRLGEGPLDAQTRDLLLVLSFELPVPEGLTWLDEILPEAPRQRDDRLAELGRWALSRGALELSAALFDRLRLRAAAEIPTRGPRAAAELARWLGLRAEVAYARGDDEAFGGLVRALVRHAAQVEAQPLARFAPHRAVANLGQTLVARLVERRGELGQDRMAAHLLEAVTALSGARSRWRGPLRALVPALAEVAGRYAEGRRPPPTKARNTPIKQLGEVVVPRLPAALTPPDHPTPVPITQSFLVHLAADGGLAAGPPWPPRTAGRTTP